ncbi:1-acyl-sn-glycerol-3-phosphate acyltransferase [Anatilimnocola aggregata]|uniref:1-acyl-sn-glycerol-3-phosphate acyltransferase n=1 Tax=Anatilimnocola aggregata TaxID=2528021 RepID=A0A517YEF7_9BACT|nr:lysophospholipid acyltransferase family protein [Anatilimnocola aggregata]QDU28613.1 1-acyl-sn-glycerol-3-phosphate acyltransferase [Anatilimnocola aggregata]
MERSWIQHAGYDAFRNFSRVFGIVVYRLRWQGAEHFPREGGALICSNHQSYFDPVLVGLTCSRRMNYLARDTLFKNPLLAPLIRFLDAIPIDREGGGLAGLKETLRRLKAGEQVLIFPEGTRSQDGEVSSLKSGFCSVARRSKVPLVPVGLDGAYQAWPRSAKLPRLGRIAVVIGEPLSPVLIASLTDEQVVSELEGRIKECHRRARAMRA